MSEEDLELLITLDDPGDAQEEDTFNHLQAENTLEYWIGQLFAARGQHDSRAEPLVMMKLTRWSLVRAIRHVPYLD